MRQQTQMSHVEDSGQGLGYPVVTSVTKPASPARQHDSEDELREDVSGALSESERQPHVNEQKRSERRIHINGQGRTHNNKPSTTPHAHHSTANSAWEIRTLADKARSNAKKRAHAFITILNAVQVARNNDVKATTRDAGEDDEIVSASRTQGSIEDIFGSQNHSYDSYDKSVFEALLQENQENPLKPAFDPTLNWDLIYNHYYVDPFRHYSNSRIKQEEKETTDDKPVIYSAQWIFSWVSFVFQRMPAWMLFAFQHIPFGTLLGAALIGWGLEVCFEFFVFNQLMIAFAGTALASPVPSFMPQGLFGANLNTTRYTAAIIVSSLLLVLDCFANLLSADLTKTGVDKVLAAFIYGDTIFLPKHFLEFNTTNELKAIHLDCLVKLGEPPKEGGNRSELMSNILAYQDRIIAQSGIVALLFRPYYRLIHDMRYASKNNKPAIEYNSILTTHILLWLPKLALYLTTIHFLVGTAPDASALPSFVPTYSEELGAALVISGTLSFYFALYVADGQEAIEELQHRIVDRRKEKKWSLPDILQELLYFLTLMPLVSWALRPVLETCLLACGGAVATTVSEKRKRENDFLLGACYFWLILTMIIRMVAFDYLLDLLSHVYPAVFKNYIPMLLAQPTTAIATASMVWFMIGPSIFSKIFPAEESMDDFYRYSSYLRTDENSQYQRWTYRFMLVVTGLGASAIISSCVYLAAKIGYLRAEGQFDFTAKFNNYSAADCGFQVAFIASLVAGIVTLIQHKHFEKRRFEIEAFKYFNAFKGSYAGIKASIGGFSYDYKGNKDLVKKYHGEHVDSFSDYTFKKHYDATTGQGAKIPLKEVPLFKNKIKQSYEYCVKAEKPIKAFDALLNEWGIRNSHEINFINETDSTEGIRARSLLKEAGLTTEKEQNTFFQFHAMINSATKPVRLSEKHSLMAGAWNNSTTALLSLITKCVTPIRNTSFVQSVMPSLASNGISFGMLVAIGTTFIRWITQPLTFYKVGLVYLPDLYDAQPPANNLDFLAKGATDPTKFLTYTDFLIVGLGATFATVIPTLFFFHKKFGDNAMELWKALKGTYYKLGNAHSLMALLLVAIFVLGGQECTASIQKAKILLGVIIPLLWVIGLDCVDEQLPSLSTCLNRLKTNSSRLFSSHSSPSKADGHDGAGHDDYILLSGDEESASSSGAYQPPLSLSLLPLGTLP